MRLLFRSKGKGISLLRKEESLPIIKICHFKKCKRAKAGSWPAAIPSRAHKALNYPMVVRHWAVRDTEERLQNWEWKLGFLTFPQDNSYR